MSNTQFQEFCHDESDSSGLQSACICLEKNMGNVLRKFLVSQLAYPLRCCCMMSLEFFPCLIWIQLCLGFTRGIQFNIWFPWICTVTKDIFSIKFHSTLFCILWMSFPLVLCMHYVLKIYECIRTMDHLCRVIVKWIM